MAATKQATTIEEYIAAHPPNVQALLNSIRQTIREAAPEASETISYSMPTFDLNGKHLIHFAAWKKHIALYPVPKGDASFQKGLAPYIGGKGTVRLPLDLPIPYDLVKKIVKFQIEKN